MILWILDFFLNSNIIEYISFATRIVIVSALCLSFVVTVTVAAVVIVVAIHWF